MVFVTNSPSENRFCSPAERAYILDESNDGRKRPRPKGYRAQMELMALARRHQPHEEGAATGNHRSEFPFMEYLWRGAQLWLHDQHQQYFYLMDSHVSRHREGLCNGQDGLSRVGAVHWRGHGQHAWRLDFGSLPRRPAASP